MTESIYAPRFDYNKYELEDRAEYLSRIQPLLPNFPKEVIVQWFYDHNQQVEEYEWLDYPSLAFSQESWKTEQVPVKDFGNVDAARTYMYHFFAKGLRTSRTLRLALYFEKFGTWPVPPVFLENQDGNLQFPHRLPCGTPYHLIEGHNRMALFLGYKQRIKLADSHAVYVVRRHTQ